MRHLQVCSAALSALIALSMPVYAEKTALERIPSREARDTVTKVEIGPGRSTLIDFPQTEVIVYVPKQHAACIYYKNFDDKYKFVLGNMSTSAPLIDDKNVS